MQYTSGTLNLAEVPDPERRGEALIRVVRSGICNTDLEIVRGYAGFEGVLGHEFVGIVEKAEGTAELVGKRVVGEINVGCGVCSRCMDGDPRHCPSRTVLGIKDRSGAHAEFLTLPAVNLLMVPDVVTDDEAVFVEPLAAAIGVTEQVAVEPTSTVAVIGDGKLGLLCAFAMALRSHRVTLIGKHRSKLDLAEGRGISALTLGDIGKDALKSFDIVVEASGSESGFSTALDLVMPRGKIVLKSTFHGTPTWEAWRVVVEEISVIGSRCGRFAPAIDALASRSIDVLPLISEVFPLSDGVRAFDAAAQKGVLKVLLSPN